MESVRAQLRLREQMAKYRVTGRALAGCLGLHVSSIVQWRNGSRMPSLNTLARVAVVLAEASGGEKSPKEIFGELIDFEG
jgi:transcriptional regulator with XRE-family HTH domain